MSKRVEELYYQAGKCRRLARSIDDKEMVTKLVKLADEYVKMAREEEADEAEQSKNTTH